MTGYSIAKPAELSTYAVLKPTYDIATEIVKPFKNAITGRIPLKNTHLSVSQ